MYTFCQFRKSKQIISIKKTAFMLKRTVYNYWRDANNYKYEKNIPGLEVIKIYFILKLKIKHNDWLLADTCPQATNRCALF